MSFKIISKEDSMVDPYDSLIKTFFTLEFPRASCLDAATKLEGAMTALLATGQVRYGPKPSPEGIVALRDIVRGAIADDRPIPMVSPFGSRKSYLGEPLDVAEVFAMKQLEGLQKRMIEAYPPGIQVNIRLEDASGPYVFVDEGIPSRAAEADYCGTFVKMIDILGFDSFIKPVLESSLFSERDLTLTADKMLPVMMDYLMSSDLYGIDDRDSLSGWKTLQALGWDNPVAVEQRDYYRGRYKSLYPGLDDRGATIKLARYFSQAWARQQLNGRGDDPSWNGRYIRLSFIGPVPGSMPSQTLRDVYYRTIPLRFTEFHTMPWRSKGYLQIDEDGGVTPKLASWRDKKEYHRNELTFTADSVSATIRADYVLK